LIGHLFPAGHTTFFITAADGFNGYPKAQITPAGGETLPSVTFLAYVEYNPFGLINNSFFAAIAGNRRGEPGN
jgi:hypothetical protein